MSRSLHADVITELAKGTQRYVHLIQIQWDAGDGGTDYLTDAQFDITDGSDTYTASAFVLGASSVEESSKINSGSINLMIGGADQTYISGIYGGWGYMDRKVLVKRCFLNDSNAIIGDTVTIYHGRIQGYSINESPDSSIIEFTVANHWTDFKRVNGRRTNPTSQQKHFPEDDGFEYCSGLMAKEITWGIGVDE